MTEATLNANNYIDICSIPSKFHMCMYEKMKNIYAQKQSSIHCPCVWKAVHNKTFWIILVLLIKSDKNGVYILVEVSFYFDKSKYWHHVAGIYNPDVTRRFDLSHLPPS